MTHDAHELVEKVAAGLRRMGKPPDFLLFNGADTGDWAFDIPEICGIPIIHNWWPFLRLRLYGSEDCPFLPCFKTPFEENYADIIQFGRGFEEYASR